MRTFNYLVIFACLCGYLFGQQKDPLTYQQVSELIRYKMPDARLAIEIKTRSIAPMLTSREAKNLLDLGAGPETQAAIGFYIRQSPLILTFRPGIEGLTVTIGDKTGVTDANGKVTMAGLSPGYYTVIAERIPTYPRTEHGITLPDGGTERVIELKPAPGRLSVILDNATIEIGSRGTYRAPIRELELTAGTYTVSVKAQYYLPYSTSVTVEPGLTNTLTPVLVPDKDVLASALQEILSQGRLNDENKFRNLATLVLNVGAERLVSIRLLHHHRNQFHNSLLTIDRSGITFDPQEGPCTWKKEFISVNRLDEVQIIREGSSGILLHIVVATGKNLTSKKELNFAVQGSSYREEREEKTPRIGGVSLGTVSRTVSRVWSPLGAENKLSAIAWLIRQIRTGT